MNVALIGSVSSSWTALAALIEAEVEVTCVCGVDEACAARISDYRSLREPVQRAGIPFLSFARVSEPAVEEFLRAHPPDLLWVIGLSQLVPDHLIGIATHGGVGFHPTFLPEGRGRAPVAWTILKGTRAAVNLFYLTEEPDAGDLIVQREVPVLPDDYSHELIDRTNVVLREVILMLGPRIRSGNLPRIPQDHSKATYWPKRTPADGLINWSASSDAVYRLIRAAGRPYQGAFTYIRRQKLTAWRARPADGHAQGERGHVLDAGTEGILVKTGDGSILLTQVEPPGVQLAAGDVLGRERA